MENKEFSRKLEERTKLFALDVIRLSVLLPTTTEGKIIKNQLTKAGTSVGANYREANRSRSRADFSNKIKICESEANETNYWLEIVEALNSWPKLTAYMSIPTSAVIKSNDKLAGFL